MVKSKTPKQTLILLDVHAILHRAYHALPDFTTKSGEPTGGLYGLISMLIKLVTDLKPDYLMACYDLPEPTFRKVAYQEYKAGRKPTDSALVSQIERSRELFQTLNIPYYEQAGFEADDIIGTLAEQAKKQTDLKIIIASGDLDTLQLIETDKVCVYTLKKGLNDTILYDEPAVRARFAFGPELLPDWKGLRGDPSDNIIGIAGIGEKTATTLITNFGSIEQIYQTLKKSPAKFRAVGLTERIIKLLRDGEDEAIFSKTLGTIRRDAPITFALPPATWQAGLDNTAVEALFERLEFRTLKDRWRKLFSIPLAPVEDLAQFPKIPPEGLEEVWEKIELPLRPILEVASARGIILDKNYLKDLSQSIHQELSILEKKIYALAGREFNINSPKQLSEILFIHLHLPQKGIKKTAGGVQSTRESELVKLEKDYPIVSEILAYRERQKLLSTYIDALPLLTDETSALHTTFDQFGAATGRLSSRDPNLQNIPIATALGQLVRRAFTARPGHHFLALDYSQIEMRVLAVLSGDEKLLELFKQGNDIHSSVAARVFNVEESAVTPEMRRQAKVINFGIVYGMGVNALRVNLATTREAAAEFYDRYFKTFPTIKDYFEKVKTEARKVGYTTTYFGRRRYLPTLRSPLPFIRAAAERMAMNAPIQGTAADIIKLAMIKTEAKLVEEGLRPSTHLLLTVHDELLYEVEESQIAPAKLIIKQAMEGAVDWPIPLLVKISTGLNWGELRV